MLLIGSKEVRVITGHIDRPIISDFGKSIKGFRISFMAEVVQEISVCFLTLHLIGDGVWKPSVNEYTLIFLPFPSCVKRYMDDLALRWKASLLVEILLISLYLVFRLLSEDPPRYRLQIKMHGPQHWEYCVLA